MSNQAHTAEIPAVSFEAVSLPLLCNAPFEARRRGMKALRGLDVLELFAFVRPAQFVLPTVHGIAACLECRADLPSIASTLLSELKDSYAFQSSERKKQLVHLVIAMKHGEDGWPWGDVILDTLDVPQDQRQRLISDSFDVIPFLPEWSEGMPAVSAEEKSGQELAEDAVRERLADLLSPQGDVGRTSAAEIRPQQEEFALGVSKIFTDDRAGSKAVLAEAGTGVGKTLGYLAPLTLAAELSGTAVWISTYTRNLQNQIEAEMVRRYPDPQLRARKAVVRKGRENYVCLLNAEEQGRSAAFLNGESRVGLGLLTRWMLATRDGDLSGSDLPGWLLAYVPQQMIMGLRLKRGECIHAACPHYHKCYVESAIRRARRAEVVIANHALVMSQLENAPSQDLPSVFAFDEGHHIFKAADSATALRLSGGELIELKRWLVGTSGNQRGGRRRRGFAERASDVGGNLGNHQLVLDIQAALVDLQKAMKRLPEPGWLIRLKDQDPQGAVEPFLLALARQVALRSDSDEDTGYSVECHALPATPEVLETGKTALQALSAVHKPLKTLAAAFGKAMGDKDTPLDQLPRLEGLQKALKQRALDPVRGWCAMLSSLLSGEVDPTWLDRGVLDRSAGRTSDVGLMRNWIDPTKVFADALALQAKSVVVTSATLRDETGDNDNDWNAAGETTGLIHWPSETVDRLHVLSPFYYPQQAKVVVVTDVGLNDTKGIASAYAQLFSAAGGGALGIFTAIRRLKLVHKHMQPLLEGQDIPLFAQHVDNLETGTLIDMFRAEENGCLLGTDALRDGVDVPGHSLRLVVMDRVPWPRPDLLHVARRNANGGRSYDQRLTRLKLKQAFGRLIRRKTDKGVFVLLDPRLPREAEKAFPAGVDVRRMRLAEAAEMVKSFLV